MHNEIFNSSPEELSVSEALTLKYNPLTRILSYGDRKTPVSKNRGVVINLLISIPRHCFSREEIIVKGKLNEEIFDRSVDDIVKKMRRAVDEITDGKGHDFIQSVYSRGYYYEPHPDNYAAHPGKPGVFTIIDPRIPFLSDNFANIGAATLDIGRSRFYHGTDYVELPTQSATLAKLIFNASAKQTLTREFISNKLIRSDKSPIPDSAVKTLRKSLSLLLPRGVVADLITSDYGVGYTVNKSVLEDLHPPKKSTGSALSAQRLFR